MDPVIVSVQQRMAAEGLTPASAARSIGISAGSLQRHLDGEYVRSDSLAKYRRWLANITAAPTQLAMPAGDETPPPVSQLASRRTLFRRKSWQPRPYNVVDLFSGCGGLSLGFELLGDRHVFAPVLAIDVDEPMVRAYNANQRHAEVPRGLCVRADLSQFLNEAEVRAFYLDHVARTQGDAALLGALDDTFPLGLRDLRAACGALDARFLARLSAIRSTAAYAEAYRELGNAALGQTSIQGFHTSLSLPQPSMRTPVHRLLLWTSESDQPELVHSSKLDEREWPRRLAHEGERKLLDWEEAVTDLRQKASFTGRGQLASSARRIQDFIGFLDTVPLRSVRDAWVEWRQERDALRRWVFENQQTDSLLDELYVGERTVHVLLGGPPCQGFSRIGRGKIRSLREHGVHVHSDAEAGDERNRLLLAYTLWISALAPRVFLFENVRHFQAEVKTPQGSFRATDVLAEAIRDVSSNSLNYSVASRIVDASKHMVPQTRERFFMVGVEEGALPAEPPFDIAEWALSMPEHEAVPLRRVLEGLPTPRELPASPVEVDLSQTCSAAAATSVRAGSAAAEFAAWITQPSPAGQVAETDAHVARSSRSDDRELFTLMGPGKRWMDYRCDESQTLLELTSLLQACRAMLDEAQSGDRGAVGELQNRLTNALEKLDGSLTLRLLLEVIEPLPGELEHHLLSPGYLAKREGNHGDWVARLHPDRPCRTIVSHMAKDTYQYVHPWQPRTLSVREAARVQTFPDWFSFGALGFVDALRNIGNAVPPLLASQIADRIAQVLWLADEAAPRAEETAGSAGKLTA